MTWVCEDSSTITPTPKPTATPTPAKKQSQTFTGTSSYKETYGSAAFTLDTKLKKGNGKLTYTSSNTKVVTVSSKGKVTIKGVGSAQITVKAAATKKYKAAQKKITVTVTKGAQKIRLAVKTSLSKNYGDKAFSLGATASGKGKLTYKSSAASVAAVSASGKVTIKGCGTATITIKAAETAYYKAVTKKVSLTVKPKKPTIKKLTSPKTRTVSVSWAKDNKASGYEVQYSASSKFTSPKNIVVTKNSTLSSTFKVSAGKKNYYVRIRSYKTVGKKKIYSSWSSAKTIKVK